MLQLLTTGHPCPLSLSFTRTFCGQAYAEMRARFPKLYNRLFQPTMHGFTLS